MTPVCVHMTWFAVRRHSFGRCCCVSYVVQFLYSESLRLRSREVPALEFFKETSKSIGLRPRGSARVFTHQALFGIAVGRLLPCYSRRASRRHGRVLLEAALCLAPMLVSTYVLPQLLYRRTKGHWMLPLAPVLRVCALLAPADRAARFLPVLGGSFRPASDQRRRPHPLEHIEALITAGAEEGIIEEDDRKLIQSVVAFGDKTVREVMTPRPNIVAIAANRSLEDLRQLVIHEQYSRIPVYEQAIDNIIGFVHVRDMFELDEPIARAAASAN